MSMNAVSVTTNSSCAARFRIKTRISNARPALLLILRDSFPCSLRERHPREAHVHLREGSAELIERTVRPEPFREQKSSIPFTVRCFSIDIVLFR